MTEKWLSRKVFHISYYKKDNFPSITKAIFSLDKEEAALISEKKIKSKNTVEMQVILWFEELYFNIHISTRNIQTYEKESQTWAEMKRHQTKMTKMVLHPYSKLRNDVF